MTHFSISQLSRFSGLKPHTIRAWEMRYNALNPARSVGNTRYYDSTQMKRLLNIVSLVNAGYMPSEVGALPDEKLHSLLEKVIGNRRNATEEYFVSQLIAAGLTYDEARFEKIFSCCLDRYRLKNTYQYIILPMLERIGLLWRCDKASPSQEHFVSNLLRRKLFASVDALPPADPNAPRWLLALPEDEFHELGLLLAYNLIRLSGQHAVYLGANVPLASLGPTLLQIKPSHLLLFTLQAELSRPLIACLKELDISFAGEGIYVAGNPGKGPNAAGLRRTQWLNTVDDLTAALNGTTLD